MGEKRLLKNNKREKRQKQNAEYKTRNMTFTIEDYTMPSSTTSTARTSYVLDSGEACSSVHCERTFVSYEPPAQCSSEQESEVEQALQSSASKKARNNHKKPAQGCFNCHTFDTPLWRRDGHGNSVCNKCGLYWMRHGMHRPEVVKTRTLGKRKKETEDTQSHKRSKSEERAALDEAHANVSSSLESISETFSEATTSMSALGAFSPLTSSLPCDSDLFFMNDFDNNLSMSALLASDMNTFHSLNTTTSATTFEDPDIFQQRLSALLGTVLPDLQTTFETYDNYDTFREQ